ncbi:MAG: FAD-binding oxidoreductase [Alphaproteobacteria bacterium]|nr:FAD-binding oxidoreductase [Alphaproteobacteria bacterium]MCB9695626.1 FAD-binding oxidoreductase [Alphaproteobacteria bacterium]
MELSGWGRFPVVEGQVVASEDLLRSARTAGLARGLGRAYGDAALPAPGSDRPVLVSTAADRVLSFDPSTGLLRAEAGLSLSTLARLFLPLGYFSPVSPGTQYVTLGGMVASDIHGKNHHVDGTFGRFVTSLKMMVADGSVLEVNREQHADLFAATLGGMGLTGIILEVEVKLTKLAAPWVYEETSRIGSFREVFSRLNAAGETWPMTVAWVDTTSTGAARGRGILNAGRWATTEESPKEPPPVKQGLMVPDVFPSGVMNGATIAMLNSVWYAKHGAADKKHVVAPGTFFWILDLAREWNRGYGKAGFTQYQCVMPSDIELYDRFLELFQKLGGASFVTVFKDCGDQGEGMLSFPKRGTTLAVDVPIRDPEQTAKMVRELNAFVLDNEGRVYLAKDAFTTSEQFKRMYPRWEEFEAVRDRYDPDRRFTSAQSVRLLGR